MKRRAGTLIALTYFSLLTLLSCFKLGYLLRFDETSLEHYLEILRVSLITLFFYIVLFSYLMRREVRREATTILQRWLPIIVTLGIPVFFAFLIGERGLPPLPIYFFGLFLMVYGWIISVRALWFLKYSFSIMAEVRKLVTEGPYDSVRHPLYLGELLILCGLSLMYFSMTAFAGLVLFTVLQVIRARVEEAQFLKEYGLEYERYQQRTGFFFPNVMPVRRQCEGPS